MINTDYSSFDFNISNNIFIGIINFIIFLANLILAPIVEALKLIIPNFENLLNYVSDFINKFIQYIPICMKALMIPKGAMVILFNYFGFLLGAYLLFRFYNFIKNIIHFIRG